jgi:uncharacterized membrane protein
VGQNESTGQAPPLAGTGRVGAIDLLRGAAMVLMALDHTRDFFTNAADFDPLDLRKTTPALFLTRWVTHFCAPVFVFLAGTGAYLYGARGRGKAELARFLVTRGLWLVVLELTLVHLGWFFNFEYPWFIALVIWAIGWSMVLLAGLALLPAWAVALVGAAIVAGHNLLDRVPGVTPFGTGWEVVTQLRPGFLTHRPREGPPPYFLVAYPVLPWFGIMALGYGFGAFWQHAGPGRRARVAALGAAATLLFVALRAANVYGDPIRWSLHEEGWATALAFLNCQKYPPSLLYVLMTLGPALLFLAAFDRPAGPVTGALVTFGRVPLFFYLLHVPLIHVVALAFAYAEYGRIDFLLTHPMIDRNDFPRGYGYGLSVVYLLTAAVVAALYPLCRWYEGIKARGRSAWLSYL